MAGNAALRTFAKHWLKPLTLIALIAPFAYLAVLWTLMLTNTEPYIMGFNPVQWTHRYLGDTAIRVLLVTLAISPIRDITGWAPIVLVRRRIGLAAFFYAFLHMLAYLGLDRNWSLQLLWEDVMIRTYIMLGMAAVTLMIPSRRHLHQRHDPQAGPQDVGSPALAHLSARHPRRGPQPPHGKSHRRRPDDPRRHPRHPPPLAPRALGHETPAPGASHGLRSQPHP